MEGNKMEVALSSKILTESDVDPKIYPKTRWLFCCKRTQDSFVCFWVPTLAILESQLQWFHNGISNGCYIKAECQLEIRDTMCALYFY